MTQRFTVRGICWIMLTIIVSIILVSSFIWFLFLVSICTDNGECAGCPRDCKELGMKHLKTDSSGFGSQECWCRKNKEVKQIW